MFEISELKAKKLTDLQVIAKSIGLTKFSQLKKLDLVYQILDKQASEPSATKVTTGEKIKTEKPKRKRVTKRVEPKTAIEPIKPDETKETTPAKKAPVKRTPKKETLKEGKTEVPTKKAEVKIEPKISTKDDCQRSWYWAPFEQWSIGQRRSEEKNLGLTLGPPLEGLPP